jgi:hypothetical protein
VFQQASYSYHQFHYVECTCGMCWYNEQEAILLMSTPNIAFTWEVLSGFWNECCSNSKHGRPWFSYWKDLLQRYVALGVDTQTLRTWMNYRAVFQDACMDYVDLQNINYDGGLWCSECPDNGVDSLASDGVTIGFQADKCHFVAPWNPDPNGPAKTRSRFKDRVLISNKVTRDLLREFGASAMQVSEVRGITLEKRDFLVNVLKVETVEAQSLIPFLTDGAHISNGQCRPPPTVCDLMFAFGTTAPACQIARYVRLQGTSIGIPYHRYVMEIC